MRGMNEKALPSDLWHAPCRMKLSESSETPKNEMQKEVFISDRGLNRPTLTA